MSAVMYILHVRDVGDTLGRAKELSYRKIDACVYLSLPYSTCMRDGLRGREMRMWWLIYIYI